ncbi:hypothetical protein LTS12_027392 [Elasticomyces elasticus]|nr:hypothetical protein LTS12_027392 [Elasticomyces elasticus]
MPVDTILYDILGVPPNSTHERIRIAYKRSAVECHPDKAAQDDRSQASANEKFILVHEAYKVLRTDKLRKDYDKKGFKAATEFEKLLNAAPGREKVAAQTLDRNHGVQSQALWDQLEADNSHNLAHTDFNKRIDWREIAQTLKQLRKKPHDQEAVTKFKLAENKWKSYVKVYGLPRRWDSAVTELIKRSAPEYHGST